MLILPIINRNRVLNVEVRLKNVKKVRSRASFMDAKESEIIVNKEKFSESSFYNSRDESAPTDFIRSKSILYPRSFLVTTKEENDNTFYDVYQVEQPPKRINDSLDKLYGKAITDLRKEIPGVKRRGRYISLEQLGMDKYFTEENINKIHNIIKNEKDMSLWPKLFKREGVSELCEIIDFMGHFDCFIVNESAIPVSSLLDTLNNLKTINTRDYRNLNRYYNMAKSNTDIYTKMSYINKIVYDRPLTLIKPSREEEKKYIKKMDEYEKAS